MKLSKLNYFDKSHPNFKEVESLLKETFCLGVLETKPSAFVKGLSLFIPIQIVGLVISVLVNIPKIIILLLIWLITNYLVSEVKQFDMLILSTAMLLLFYKDILVVLNDVVKATLIILSGGLLIRWIAKGYIDKNPFRQGMIENDVHSNLITAMAAMLRKDYAGKYDYLLGLYLESKDEKVEKTLKQYMQKLQEENTNQLIALNQLNSSTQH